MRRSAISVATVERPSTPVGPLLGDLAFEAAPTPLLVIDRDLTIIACNQLARDWLDCQAGRTIADGLAQVDIAANATALALVRSGALPRPIMVGHPAEADGRPRRATAAALPGDPDGRVVLALSYSAAGAREQDELTGLLSRRSILDALSRRMAESCRSGVPLTVALLDLDRFKRVNDRLGHAAGDAALRATASALLTRLRATDDAGRLGGDELLVLLPAADASAARGLVEEVLGRVADVTVSGRDRVQRLSASAGYCVFTGDAAVTAGELLRVTDDALAQAKCAGRSCAVELPAPTGPAPVEGRRLRC